MQSVSHSSHKNSNLDIGHFFEMTKVVRKFDKQTTWTVELDSGDNDAKNP